MTFQITYYLFAFNIALSLSILILAAYTALGAQSKKWFAFYFILKKYRLYVALHFGLRLLEFIVIGSSLLFIGKKAPNTEDSTKGSRSGNKETKAKSIGKLF